MKEVYVVKMAKFRLPSLTKRKIMTIKIEITEKVYARLKKGEFVQGSLHLDKVTKVKVFNDYVMKSRMPGYVPPSYKLIAELDNGWLKESATKIIRRESFPKRLGTARIMSLMDAGNKQAKDAMIDREIINNQ